MVSHDPTPPASTTPATGDRAPNCPLPTAHSPLPPLSDRESHLLAAFITLKFNLFKLAQHEKLLPHELLAFSQSAAIQSHLAALRAFAEDAFALRALQSRTDAIELLEAVAKASDNPIEQRRTASAILRGLNLPGGTTLRGVSSRATQFSGTTCSRRPGSPSESPSGAAVTCQGRKPLDSASNEKAPTGRHSSTPATTSDLASFLALASSTLAPRRAIPLDCPDPALSELAVVETFVNSLQNSDHKDHLATLDYFLDHAATLNDHQLHADTLADDIRGLIPPGPIEISDQGESENTRHFQVTPENLPPITLSLRRAPASDPFPNSWLIAAIHEAEIEAVTDQASADTS